MIRFIFAMGWLAVFLICSIPLMIIEWIIGKFNKDFHDRSSLAIVQWAFRVMIVFAGTKVIVKGEENVPKDTAVMYVGNHRSYFDIILTYIRVPRPTGYISKKEMDKIPLLGIWMRHLHCLFLDRHDIKQGLQIILTAIEKAKSGISICVFPEGTRNKGGEEMLPFHEGSFKIAEKAGVPIIPITLVNTAEIFENHLPKIKKTTVIIEYGEPIYMNQMERDERKHIGAKVREMIGERYKELEKELQLPEKN
ncbi:MAG: 1-acyl-sn-glycerol-3-phosphate acyltransferase [Lachnospiraceae bacterium]|nr:1-acyl-sn-glycerol-3-phosphate acyltransferase [Lachnospiraceae bacterium]